MSAANDRTASSRSITPSKGSCSAAGRRDRLAAATARRSAERRRFHRRSEEVADGLFGRADAVPALPHPDERLLHEVLGLRRVVRDEQEGPEQPLTLRFEELLEGERDSKAFR